MDTLVDDIEFLTNTCFTKKQLSYDIAQKLAKKWSQRPYCCQICGYWHMTKMSEAEFLDRIELVDKPAIVVPQRPKKPQLPFRTGSSKLNNKLHNTKWTLLPDAVLLDVLAIISGEINQAWVMPFSKNMRRDVVSAICQYKWTFLSKEQLLKIKDILCRHNQKASMVGLQDKHAEASIKNT
jgi:hypothetical protein